MNGRSAAGEISRWSGQGDGVSRVAGVGGWWQLRKEK